MRNKLVRLSGAAAADDDGSNNNNENTFKSIF